MRILSASIHNLGLYHGAHHFDFEPGRNPSGPKRPLTVVSGHNGAGKSTLFQAVALGIHGSQACGSRVTNQAYEDFILSRFHRRDAAGQVHVSSEARVSVTLQWTRLGEPLQINLQRRWHRSGRRVSEAIEIYCNGRAPDVPREEYQNWINELFPPSLAPLCFFDAERLDALASPEQHNQVLQGVLHRALGIDLVDRLLTDLNQHLLRRTSSPKRERFRKNVLERQVEHAEVAETLSRRQAERTTLGELIREQEQLLGIAREAFSAEGGVYAAQRPVLEKRLEELDAELCLVCVRLEELCGELLPFALAPNLCHSLDQRLKRENEHHRRANAEEIWRERVSEFTQQLRSDALWHGIDVSPAGREELSNRILSLVGRPVAWQYGDEPDQQVHPISEIERTKLQGWIQQALEEVPREAERLGSRIQLLREERELVERELNRAPDEATLAPLHAAVKQRTAALEELRTRQAHLNEEIGGLRSREQVTLRALEKAQEEYRNALGDERQVSLADRSRLVLRTYKDALVRQRLQALETSLLESFNRLCRKDQLLRNISFDPDSFAVLLHGDDQDFTLGSLSAGERQLYVLALFEALRTVCGKQLPLFIDTPVARLDETHRRRVLHDYLPQVSDQSVLFTTDVEMDDTLLAEAGERVSRVYRLRYDGESQATTVERLGPSLFAHPAPVPLATSRSLTHVV